MTTRNRSGLTSSVAQNLPDNTTGVVTPAGVRSTLQDIIDSAVNKVDDSLAPPDGSITNLKLASVPTATFKGRATTGSGSPEDLNPTQAASLLQGAFDARYAPLVRAAYTGQVATRTRIPNAFNASFTQAMSRTIHVARDNITALQVLFACWYVDGTTRAETGTPNTGAFQASIEYPAGTYQQLTFGGGFQGLTGGGTTLFSDLTQMSIPAGAEFWVRTYYTNPSGILYADNVDVGRGEAFAYGTSVANQVMGGTITSTAGQGGPVQGPCAIIGQTTKASFCFVGDSRLAGATDTYADTSHNIGSAERSLAALTPVMNLGVPGDRAQNYVTSHALRLALSQYCSHILCNYGINDLASARTSTQVLADLATIRGYFTGKPFIQTTLEPWTTSTDAWATTTNQTPAAWDAQRVSVNTAIRAGTVADKFVDIADTLESARNSGIWGAGYTTDGIHPNNTGTMRAKNLQTFKLASLV
jgi:lysophospholipase L1-like esterase